MPPVKSHWGFDRKCIKITRSIIDWYIILIQLQKSVLKTELQVRASEDSTG